MVEQVHLEEVEVFEKLNWLIQVRVKFGRTILPAVASQVER